MSLLEWFEMTVKSRKLLGVKRPDGYKYSCFEELVLDQGKDYASSALTQKEWKTVRHCLHFTTVKMCFYNCQKVVACYPEARLTYVEGFAVSEIGFPMLHAWLVTPSQKVLDPTWRIHQQNRWFRRKTFPDRAMGTLPHPREYCGLEITEDDVLARLRDGALGGSFIDDFENRWPLLRGEGTIA